MNNEWFKSLSHERKQTVMLQLYAGDYYDFYSEEELVEMYRLSYDDIENFDYEEYIKRLYMFEEDDPEPIKKNVRYGLIHWTPDGYNWEDFSTSLELILKEQKEYPNDENNWTSIEEIYEDEEGNEIRTDLL